jgi:hypothetical protein
MADAGAIASTVDDIFLRSSGHIHIISVIAAGFVAGGLDHRDPG